ncbi:MAG: CSLREA domain-containing protein, partial [Candidatus Bipolaricaulia bacterium]
MIQKKTLIVAVGLAIAAVFAGVPSVYAQIYVTTTDDELNTDGDCSLREAVEAVNTDGPVDN